MPTNDNDPATREETSPPSDAHGQAALLLVESLIHGLCENATLSTRQAVEITERAVEVQLHKAESAGGADTSMWASHGLLTTIAASLRIPDGSAHPPLNLI